MTQLPNQTYGALRFLLDLLGVEKQEIEKEVEVFEEGLQLKVIERLAKRLAENDKKPLMELANKVGEKSAKQEELVAMLKNLFNENEVKEAYVKSGEEFFNEVLKEEYGKATEEQKKKIEEMFKKEALNE